MIEAGYDLLEKQRFPAACDLWLEAWDMLRLMMPGRMRAIEEATLAFSKKIILSCWCRELQEALMRAGLEDEAYFGKLAAFIKEFCDRLPESGRIVLANMKLAGAESFYIQGKLDIFKKSLKKIALEFPDLVIESHF